MAKCGFVSLFKGKKFFLIDFSLKEESKKKKEKEIKRNQKKSKILKILIYFYSMINDNGYWLDIGLVC